MAYKRLIQTGNVFCFFLCLFFGWQYEKGFNLRERNQTHVSSPAVGHLGSCLFVSAAVGQIWIFFIIIIILFFSQNLHMFTLLTVIIPPGKAEALCSVRHGGQIDFRLIVTDIYRYTKAKKKLHLRSRDKLICLVLFIRFKNKFYCVICNTRAIYWLTGFWEPHKI